MSYLSDLERRLRNLQDDKVIKEKALTVQKSRKNEIHNIIAGLGSSDYTVSCISMNVQDICYELPSGFKWTEHASGLPDQLVNEKEEPFYTDTDLGEAYSSLKAELSATELKIKELEEEIRGIKSSISSTQSAISAEKSRLAEEARREAERRAEQARAAAAAAAAAKAVAAAGKVGAAAGK